MKTRSQHLFDDGPLTVEMVSLNDIFLFKSVANREDDVDDMIVLAQAGLDEDIIMDEVMIQLDHLGRDQFIGAMKHKLDRIEDRGFSFDIHDEVAALHDRVGDAQEVSQTLFAVYDAEYHDDDLYKGVPRSRLRQQVRDDIDLDMAIDWLERTDRLRVATDDSIVPEGSH